MRRPILRGSVHLFDADEHAACGKLLCCVVKRGYVRGNRQLSVHAWSICPVFIVVERTNFVHLFDADKHATCGKSTVKLWCVVNRGKPG